jgi:hypothetical protein
MPRYHFNVIYDGREIRDREGSELPDIEAARIEAVADARALMSEAVRNGWDISGRSINICSGTGDILMTINFSDAIKRLE